MKIPAFFILILIPLFLHPVQAQGDIPEIEMRFLQGETAAKNALTDAKEAINQANLATNTYDANQIEKHISQAEAKLNTAHTNADLASDIVKEIKIKNIENNLKLNEFSNSTDKTLSNLQTLIKGTDNEKITKEQANLKKTISLVKSAIQVNDYLGPERITKLSDLSESANMEIEKAAKAIDEAKKFQNSDLTTSLLTGFGFGPAYFLVDYDSDVLGDPNDIRIRKDKKIAISGTKKESFIGLELHYGFSFGTRCRNSYAKKKPPCNDSTEWKQSSGHTLTPYLGLFDLEEGFNGYSIGLLYGFWRGDNEFNDKTSLNVGIGRFVHKNRLVPAKGIDDGGAEVTDFEISDYSRKKDIYGYSLMISAEIGF